ncbi:MAG: fumarylacetoacetate hydrolase family protein [Rhodospirillales bacterium]|nr:fumarylacetoacetate hydrolase family protein [Rhodospirillales bacterium]
MKLIRYGQAGHEKPGLIDAQGTIRDLSGHIGDIGPDALGDETLNRLRAIDPATLPAVEGEPRMGVPVAGIGKILGVGLNYKAHAEEAGMDLPSEPIIFSKAVTSLTGPDDGVTLPRGSTKTDWEVELAVIIGTKAQYVDEARALDYIAGYAVINDISEREYQIERNGTWDKGKGCDTFAPLGPWLVTRDEVPDPQNLDLWLERNGERLQASNTERMIFGVAHLVSYLSRFMTLMPGDVIATGTPPGVGMGFNPPVYLKAGDTMRLGVAGMGEQNQTVKAG